MNATSIRWFLVVVFALSSCTPKPVQSPLTPEIVVGEVGSMTGPEASFGQTTHRGIELAINEINAKGGVKGRPLKLVTIDDQGKSDEAALATQKLIAQDHAIAILGEVASSRSLAMAPVAQRLQVPMITPSSANERVTQTGDYVFRGCFTDELQAKAMARYAFEKLKLKRIALFKDYKNDYSIGMAEHFKKDFTRRGGSVAVEQSYSAGDADFKAQLTQIRGAKPDAIFVPGYYTDVGLIARQARALEIQAPLLGGDGWDSPKLIEIGQAAMEGSYFINHFSADAKNAKTQSFVANFKKAYGMPPDGLAALAYDATWVLHRALETSSEITRVSVREALSKIQGFEGVTGSIAFDKNRNPVKPAVVLKVDQGRFVYESTIQP